MKRFALRLGRLTAALASAGVLLVGSCGESSLAHSAPAGRDPATVVLETTCLNPDDAVLAAPARARLQDGTLVDLWCGSRLEVTAGRCAVRLGDELTGVPCLTPPGSAPGPRRPGGPTAG